MVRRPRQLCGNSGLLAILLCLSEISGTVGEPWGSDRVLSPAFRGMLSFSPQGRPQKTMTRRTRRFGASYFVTAIKLDCPFFTCISHVRVRAETPLQIEKRRNTHEKPTQIHSDQERRGGPDVNPLDVYGNGPGPKPNLVSTSTASAELAEQKQFTLQQQFLAAKRPQPASEPSRGVQPCERARPASQSSG